MIDGAVLGLMCTILVTSKSEKSSTLYPFYPSSLLHALPYSPLSVLSAVSTACAVLSSGPLEAVRMLVAL